MKLFILALDGMDYDLAARLNLENTLQKQYGKLKVPINKNLGCPTSPEVWASFLCAENVKIEFMAKKRNWALKPLRFLKERLPFISLGIGRKVTGGGLMVFPELKRETWVDNPKVKEIGVPYYSYTNEAFEYSRQFGEDKNLELYRKRLYLLFLKKSRELLSEVKALDSDSFEVVFAYLHFPDLFNHSWFTNKERLMKYYSEIDEYVEVFKKELGNSQLLIISDHGFDFSKNEHSDLGFISSNFSTKFPKTIIELGKQIEDMLKNE
jgi:hypothetical protein